MFIIDFRNKNVSEYRFSVIGNSNVDKVHLVSAFSQYASDCSIYLKVRSNEENYVDKIAIASENISIDDGALVCKWTMGAVSTQCKKLYLQLQFEKEGDIIAQTGIVGLTLADSINVDELIPVIYPQVLKHLQEQIDDLKAESVAIGSMSYSDDILTLLLKNKDGTTLTSMQVAIPTSDKMLLIDTRGLTIDEVYAISNEKPFFMMNGTRIKLHYDEGYELDAYGLATYSYGEESDGTVLFNTFVENSHLVKFFISGTNDANKLYGTDDYGQQVRYNEKDYARNVGVLPHYEVASTDNAYLFFNTNSLFGKLVVLNISGDNYLCVINQTTSGGNHYDFEFVKIGYGYGSNKRYTGLQLAYNEFINLTFSDIFAGQTYSNDYQLLKDKTTWITDTSTDVQYPSARAVWQLVQAIKRNAFTPVDTTTYPTLANFLASTGEEGYLYLYPVDTSDLTKGYKQYIWENNAWVYLGDTQLDLTGYYQKSENVIPTTTNTYDLGSSTYTFKDLYLGGSINFDTNHSIYFDTYDIFLKSSTIWFDGTYFCPRTNGGGQLGTSNYKWRDIYLSGSLSDGTNSFTIAHAYNLLENVIDSTSGILSIDKILEESISADKTYNVPANAVGVEPECRAIITNSGNATITLSFVNVKRCLCNDSNAVISSTEDALTHIWTTTITLSASASYEISIMHHDMIAVNFSAI